MKFHHLGWRYRIHGRMRFNAKGDVTITDFNYTSGEGLYTSSIHYHVLRMHGYGPHVNFKVLPDFIVCIAAPTRALFQEFRTIRILGRRGCYLLRITKLYPEEKFQNRQLAL
jgi:hypothetical protein